MAKAVVKHKMTGEKFRIVGQYKDFLWLQAKDAPNDAEPFSAHSENYVRHVETEPQAGEIWERQRGTETTQRKVLGTVDFEGQSLVVWEDERREQVAATAVADFVRTHKFNGMPTEEAEQVTIVEES